MEPSSTLFPKASSYDFLRGIARTQVVLFTTATDAVPNKPASLISHPSLLHAAGRMDIAPSPGVTCNYNSKKA